MRVFFIVPLRVDELGDFYQFLMTMVLLMTMVRKTYPTDVGGRAGVAGCRATQLAGWRAGRLKACFSQKKPPQLQPCQRV
jgi:hypothetical protein